MARRRPAAGGAAASVAASREAPAADDGHDGVARQLGVIAAEEQGTARAGDHAGVPAGGAGAAARGPSEQGEVGGGVGQAAVAGFAGPRSWSARARRRAPSKGRGPSVSPWPPSESVSLR